MLGKFFQDKRGKVVVWQAPNMYLWGWIVFTIAGRLFETGKTHELISTLAFVSIIIWSYLEITDGVNYFRRSLGATVLTLSILSRMS